jgi:ribosome maturation factor RimP
MSVSERVRAVIEPLVAEAGLDLFDLDHVGGMLRVSVDRTGGVDIDAIAALTRSISRALDENDPIAGRYTLEVSSPGLERPLRTPAHFAWAVGHDVTIKTVATFDGPRRIAGVLQRAGDDQVEVAVDGPGGDVVTLPYDQIDKARTVFDWGPTPKPGGPSKTAGSKTSKTTKTSRKTQKVKAS